MSHGRRIDVRGTVQGVGFRPWVYRLAHELGLEGWVKNDSSGVTIEAFGADAGLDAFVRRLVRENPPASEIADIHWEPVEAQAPGDFVIAPSEEGTKRQLAVPPDLATCSKCHAELLDPNDRRYRYPFINCTDCGPRYTIVCDVPYDRQATTMAGFVMCARCRQEYDNPRNRRFHAEPNACPVCGPRMWALAPDGKRLDGEPFELAADHLRAGLIVAVKGIGGFHLACDAKSPEAVARLRRRKRREQKPLAVMVKSLAEARRLGVFGAAAARLLTSVERPIVLVHRRQGAPVAPDVVNDKSPLLGLFLPYSPIHHLLFESFGGPLVMTSGNFSDSPLAYQNEDALSRLGKIADLFLMHDRGIEAPVDDPVARIVAGRPMVMRRGRGYVPGPIPVHPPFESPILACGGDLKNAFCLASADRAYLAPHIGDLEGLETYEHLEASVARLERLLGVRPALVAHDMHPGYFSTKYALSRGLPTLAVQHHHAHVASAMAEHGLEGPVIGIAYDGTGYGLDGVAWGGEILVASSAGFERLATHRALRLAGGDLAIRQPWRLALAALEDAYQGDPPLARLAAFDSILPNHVAVVRGMIHDAVQTPKAHGCGRWFDAIGALVLGRTVCYFEGQVATSLNLVADPDERRPYPFELDLSSVPWQLDLRPTVRAVVDDLLAGRSAARISARFQNTLVAGTVELVRRVAVLHGGLPVVLTGGCFQNAWLAEGISAELAVEHRVHLHSRVPPGDGGLALGQALIAAEHMRGM